MTQRREVRREIGNALLAMECHDDARRQIADAAADRTETRTRHAKRALARRAREGARRITLTAAVCRSLKGKKAVEPVRCREAADGAPPVARRADPRAIDAVGGLCDVHCDGPDGKVRRFNGSRPRPREVDERSRGRHGRRSRRSGRRRAGPRAARACHASQDDRARDKDAAQDHQGRVWITVMFVGRSGEESRARYEQEPDHCRSTKDQRVRVDRVEDRLRQPKGAFGGGRLRRRGSD